MRLRFRGAGVQRGGILIGWTVMHWDRWREFSVIFQLLFWYAEIEVVR